MLHEHCARHYRNIHLRSHVVRATCQPTDLRPFELRAELMHLAALLLELGQQGGDLSGHFGPLPVCRVPRRLGFLQADDQLHLLLGCSDNGGQGVRRSGEDAVCTLPVLRLHSTTGYAPSTPTTEYRVLRVHSQSPKDRPRPPPRRLTLRLPPPPSADSLSDCVSTLRTRLVRDLACRSSSLVRSSSVVSSSTRDSAVTSRTCSSGGMAAGAARDGGWW